ncbi:MAG: hypothetical protein V5A72_02975 [Candidatus Nanohaloarchaea archaeon]
MKASLSIDQLALIILTLFTVTLGISILYSVDSDKPELSPIEKSVKNSDFPICQDFEPNQTVNGHEFRTLIYGRYYQGCEKNNNSVELGFKLEDKIMEDIAKEMSDQPEVIHREDCETVPGFEGIIMEETPGALGTFGNKTLIKGSRPVMVCRR